MKQAVVSPAATRHPVRQASSAHLLFVSFSLKPEKPCNQEGYKELSQIGQIKL
jgi:hypothetical protein